MYLEKDKKGNHIKKGLLSNFYPIYFMSLLCEKELECCSTNCFKCHSQVEDKFYRSLRDLLPYEFFVRNDKEMSKRNRNSPDKKSNAVMTAKRIGYIHLSRNNVAEKTKKIKPDQIYHSSKTKEVIHISSSNQKMKNPGNDKKNAQISNFAESKNPILQASGVDSRSEKDPKKQRATSVILKPLPNVDLNEENQKLIEAAKICKFFERIKANLMKVSNNDQRTIDLVFYLQGKHWIEHTKASVKYVIDQDVFEKQDLYTKFKNHQPILAQTIVDNICSFLNRPGGTIYFGIDNGGFVRGYQTSRKALDHSINEVDCLLYECSPKIHFFDYDIHIHDIAYDVSKRLISYDRFVIQIDVYRHPTNDFVYSNNRQFLVRRNASMGELWGADILKYIDNKRAHEKFIQNGKLNDASSMFENMQLRDLEDSIKTLEEHLELAKYFVKNKVQSTLEK